MTDITTDQRFDAVTLSITDSKGRPAKVEGAPAWATSDATILSVTPAADGMSAVIDTIAPGTARITVTADADVGAGVTTITGVSEDIVVTIGPNSVASTVSLSLGAPTEKV